ncbi:MAG: hypothetical protein LCH43_11340 [Actinobacteria bacterium]|nr:hypothetical protein [Actinomycetota bacterium]
MSVAEMIEGLAVQSVRAQADAVEQAVERMLVSPGPLGVLVESWPDGSWRVSLSSEVAPMEITYQAEAAAR